MHCYMLATEKEQAMFLKSALFSVSDGEEQDIAAGDT